MIFESVAMAALQYLESLRNSHPELSDWYNSLADLYQKKLWHQLTLKLEQFVALAVFQVPLLSSSLLTPITPFYLLSLYLPMFAPFVTFPSGLGFLFYSFFFFVFFLLL